MKVSPVPGQVKKARVKLLPEDREFLAPALEILETPASPVGTALIWIICIGFFGLIAWSILGWIDIHAVAPGRIQPKGRSKIVQPFEAGKVVATHVENGSRVAAGEILLELDRTETAADREAQTRDLEAANAEAVRRKAAIEAARAGSSQTAIVIEFDADISSPTRYREEKVLIADLTQLETNRSTLVAQLEEKAAKKVKLSSTINERAKLLELSRERIRMRETVQESGGGSRALVIESMQQYETNLTTDLADRGELLETDAACRALEWKIKEATTQFIAEQTQKLAEVERKRERLIADLIKARSKNERTVIKSPVNGVVQQLAISTAGQVVSAGQALMVIVPQDTSLEVEALIPNKDIGFVRAGQAAVIKVEAFPFTRYGTIDGLVTKVSSDGVDQRDAMSSFDAANMGKAQSGSSGQSLDSVQNIVFPATISLAAQSMSVNGKEVPLSPGMLVTVEVKTGKRRLINYLLSPLLEVISDAGHER